MPRASGASSKHRPRFYLKGLGLLDRPLSRAMTSDGALPETPQPLRRRAVDRAVVRDDHAVVLLRAFARNESVGDVGGDRLGIAPARRAMAAAARQLEPQEIAGRHGLTSLRPDRPA